MSLYVYAPRISPGTKELIEALQAKRLVKHDGMRFLHKGVPMEFNPADTIICWGAHVPPIPGVFGLNMSYKYADMFNVNRQGLRDLANKGYTTFQLGKMSDKDYLEGLKVTGWPKTAPPSNYVSVPEIYSYGAQHFKFNTFHNVLVFGGKVVMGEHGKLGPMPAEIMKILGLDFAVLGIGMTNLTGVVVKIITAPHLDADGVTLFATNIKRWLKENGK